jgi:hypothetical protein
MATLQGKAVKNTYRQVLQIGANNVGVSGTLQPVQDGAGVNTALSLSTLAATVNGDLTITGDLIITGGGIQIKDLIDDTVAALIQNGTGITWTYNDAAATLTGNFTGTTSVVPEGSNLYYTQGRFDSAFAAKSTTNLAEGTNLYFTTARGNANFATNLAASDTDDLAEGATNLYFTNARARTALSVTAGTGLSYNNTTGVFNLAAIPNASLTNSSITINGQAVSLGGSVTLTTTNIAEGTNLYWTDARGNSNFATNLAASTTTNLAEGTNLYYTQARFDTAFSNKSTTNLAEGTNLYYTQARFNSALAAKTTTDLAEGTNLYYTDARARLALSSSATGLSYANNSGVFSLTAGYAIPTTVKLGQYDIAYNRSIVSAAVTGTSTKTLSLTQQDANVITATWTDQGITTINGTANQIAATTVGNTTTLAFTNDVTMPNNLVVSGNLTINGTATYVNTESISSKDPLFEVANTNNTTDAVDIGYYGRYYDAVQERVEFTGLFRDASDAGKFKIFNGLVDEPTNVVNTTGTGYTVATLVANVDGNLNGTANAANTLSTARTISATGDAAWSVSFDGSANATAALTLANTGVTASTYGTTTAVPTIAIDSKGRITSASNTNIAFPVTTVNGQAGTVVLTTSNVAEGSNQYFTTARAQASITGAASSVVTADLTASRVLVSDGTGKIAASASITTTDLGYLSGVTSAIQTQLDSKLNLSGGTLTGGLSGTTGSFSGILTTPEVKAATSAGLSINANSGTQVANFGAGGGANITLYGGLTGTSASFSSTLGVTGALTGTNGTFTAAAGVSLTTNGVAGQWSTRINGSSTSGSSYGLGIYAGTNSSDDSFIVHSYAGTQYFRVRGDGAATFASIIGVNGATEAGWSIKSNGNLKVEGGSGTTILQINDTATGGKTWSQISAGAGNVHSVPNGTFYLRNSSDGITALSVSSGGHVGIRVVPNAAWGTNMSALQIGSGGVLSNFTGANNNFTVGVNAYDNGAGSQLRLYDGAVSNVGFNGDVITFANAASGSANTAITYTERMKITSTGKVVIDNSLSGDITFFAKNTSSSGYGAAIQGGNGSGNYCLKVDNYAATTYFQIRGDGYMYSLPTYNNGAGLSANVGVAGDGSFYRATSSLKYKRNVNNYTKGLAEVMQLRAVSYQGINELDGDNVYAGLIAEEVHDLGLTEFVQYAEDGTPDALAYQNMVALAFKAIQELKAEIDELKAK